MLVLANLNLNGNELQNAKVHLLASDPSSPSDGLIWVNTTDNVLKARLGGATRVFGRLDQLSPPSAAVSLNSQKITSLADPTTATDGANKQYVDGRRLDQAAAPTGAVSLNSQRITNLADPTGAQDAATKAYIDGAVAGFAWKDEARVATTANVDLSTGLANGQVIDGVTLATGDRVLVKNQTTGSQNGIYVVPASGAASRATDADTAAKIQQAAIFVMEGTSNADTAWVNSTNAPITLGTTALTFVKFAGGASASVNKYSANVGNGSLTSITVTHNLGTTDVHVSVYRANALVMPDVTIVDANSITLTYAVAPTTNQDRVVVIG